MGGMTTTMKGLGKTLELERDTLTLRTKKGERILPLEAIAGVEFKPARSFTPGHLRVELVADWTAPGKPAVDVNTIQYAGTVETPLWEALAGAVAAAADAATPKRSLPEFAHHEGSGWPEGTVARPPAPVAAPTIGDPRLGAAVMLAGLTLSNDTIIYRGQSQPVAGATAHVSEAGGIDRRTTATRVAAGALVAGKVGAVVGAVAKKKVDTRKLYLHVAGEKYTWAVELNPRDVSKAQRVAARINTAARR